MPDKNTLPGRRPVVTTALQWFLVGAVQAGNKFETIGGGVAGSTPLKLAYLRPIGMGFGTFFLVAALLSLSGVGRGNALSPNYSLWRQSALVLFLLSVASFGVALMV